MIRITLLSVASFLFSAALQNVLAQEPSLSQAGAAYAPLDVSKQNSDPSTPLSKSQRDDLLGEFKGLVHMGLRQVPLEHWEGKEMADCDKAQRSEDHWNYRCEIITGQGNGYYYFSPTLQELDIRIHAADEHLLEDFRRPIQEMLGRATFVQRPAVQARPTSVIRHWSSGSEMAELFIDQGSVRFIWQRR